jgi:3-deoxy-manno-octulosonate cytidylyltransferase (CMP-KDO synthetase)
MKIIGIIPCRYQSSRFPGKPLALIGGKPMMWHTYQRAIESGVLDEVYIATEDDRIVKVANEYRLNVIMTSDTHETGTDRVAEVSKKIQADYYINIQGDEPFINPETIKIVTSRIVNCKDKDVAASNAYSLLEKTVDILSADVVKVIMNFKSFALSYSRSPIPYPKFGHVDYYKQLGLYGFTKKGLESFSNIAPGPIENSEQVEMYRFIEHGLKVLMVGVNDDSISVDTKDDLDQVQKNYSKKNSARKYGKD